MLKLNGVLLLFVMFLLSGIAAASAGEEQETGKVTDVDGNIYKTVKIGDQWWMAENLKVKHYRNGEAIPNVTDNAEWKKLKTGAYCAYDNADSNISAYGLLYNWYVVGDSNNIAPKGWHVPSDKEFMELQNYLVSNGYNWDGTKEGNKIGKALSARTDWKKSPEAGNVGNDLSINNASGFTALPGGARNYAGNFADLGSKGYWWSSKEYNSKFAGRGALYSINSGFNFYGYSKSEAFGLRLIKD